MTTEITRFRPQEQALAQVADELGILQKSTNGAMLINLGDPRLKDQYNVLAPATTLAKADPNFTPALHVLSLEAGDFYGVDFEGSGQNRRPKTFALSKVQLDQIAKVAGIEDLPPNIVYFGAAHENVRVTWTARIRRPDGTWQTASGSREWIEADEKERLLTSVPDWVTKDGRPADSTNSAYNDWWAKNWYDRVKKHRLGMTETKARLRAYRSLLTVKAKYTAEDIRKPFIIASTMFTPDTSDIRIVGMLMNQGQQAAGLLYGPTATVEADDTGEHLAGEIVDHETGELMRAGEPEAAQEASETYGDRPKDDVEIPRGPFAHKMLSEVCRDNETYVRTKLLTNEKLGPLCEEWLRYFHGDDGGYDDVTF